MCATLFTRVHNRLLPTNAGKVFVNFARNMLQIESDMAKHIEAYRKGHGGGIYLQCEPLLADMVRAHVVPAFHELHPDMHINVVESHRQAVEESLLNASADYGLYFSCQEEHPVLDSRIVAEDELVYCFGTDAAGLEPPFCKLPPRPIMLAPKKSTLRMEQVRILEALFACPPFVVCEAQPDILGTLADIGAADTILPKRFLSPSSLCRCTSFRQPQYYYLLKVHHPGRTLPLSIKDLSRLLDHVFGTYFTHSE